LNADANPAETPPPEPNPGVVNPSRSVAVAPNSGIVVSGPFRARRNRADEVEQQLARNHAERRAQIGIDEAGMRDRAAARFADGRARVRGADVDHEPVADPLRDADGNRELADPVERESRTEAVRLEVDTGVRTSWRPAPQGGRAASAAAMAIGSRAKAHHGLWKMMRRTPEAWTTLVMPWLSVVGLLMMLLTPVCGS
jgi:hypothetical protein